MPGGASLRLRYHARLSPHSSATEAPQPEASWPTRRLLSPAASPVLGVVLRREKSCAFTFGLATIEALAARFNCTWCGYEATSEEERRLISSQRLCEPCLFEGDWIRRRKEIPGWARGMVQSQDAAILNIEAFGHGRSAEILDLALITPDGQHLFSSPFRPKYPLPLPFEAEDTSWLMNEKDIPAIPAIWPQLIALLGRFPHVICYNADFHHTMLDRSARQDQLIVPAVEWYCLMKIYAQFRAKLRRDGEFLWCKLNDACKEEKVNAGHSYRALPRAQRVSRLLKALAAKTELKVDPPEPSCRIRR